MKMYVKVMAVVIACMLIGGDLVAANTTGPATGMGWFKKKKKKPEKEEEKSKTDYEKLIEGSHVAKGYVPLSGNERRFLRSTAKRHVPRGFRRTVL